MSFGKLFTGSHHGKNDSTWAKGPRNSRSPTQLRQELSRERVGPVFVTKALPTFLAGVAYLRRAACWSFAADPLPPNPRDMSWSHYDADIVIALHEDVHE